LPGIPHSGGVLAIERAGNPAGTVEMQIGLPDSVSPGVPRGDSYLRCAAPFSEPQVIDGIECFRLHCWY
jgi:hypothetical protein